MQKERVIYRAIFPKIFFPWKFPLHFFICIIGPYKPYYWT